MACLSWLLACSYFLTQKIKEAQSVGILIGTLGVANYMHVIAHIKQLCSAAQKQHYVFLMGKLNPAKLANFSEVDVYCLIACHENSMVGHCTSLRFRLLPACLCQLVFGVAYA